LLQNVKHPAAKPSPVCFYLFDLLNLDGWDLTGQPLRERRAALKALFEFAREPLRLSPSLDGRPARLWKRVQRHGLEGIVAKCPDSHYEPGRRSGAWVKVKALNQQEFVIGGYSPPRRGRSFFGAVAVGYYKGKRNLLFASKVGTGFDQSLLQSLFALFQKYRTNKCPFANLPSHRGNGAGQSISLRELKQMTWLKPKLVCQVKFQEWTREGNLRQPVFLGLRADRVAEEVVRESATEAAGPGGL
jgi:bifunctional non-homologous end joining protein LigD